MQEIKKKKRAVALFVIVLICLCGWWAVRKEGFFLDEIYSYGLANSSYVPFLSWLHGGEQVASGKLPEAVSELCCPAGKHTVRLCVGLL